eukprot:RCo016358
MADEKPMTKDAKDSLKDLRESRDNSKELIRDPELDLPVVQQKLSADFTGATLRFCHALGYRRLTSRTAEHMDNESLVYLVGKHVAVFNYEAKTHRFLMKAPKTSMIVDFCVSANRRYLALSEKLLDDGGVQVSLFNFSTGQKVRSLNMSHLSRQPVTAMDFSADNKYLVTVTEPPDGLILMWQLDKARLAARCEFTFKCSRISVSPWFNWKICTTGEDVFRVWHFYASDKTLKPSSESILKRRDYHYNCHSWFDSDKLILGTEEGDLLVMVGEGERGMELKKALTAVHDGAAIWAVCVIGRGCICGGDGGYFTLFERSYDDYLQPYKRFRTADRQRIHDLSVSPNEENLVCCQENNSMVFFSLANVDIMRSEDGSNFKPLSIGFHSSSPTAIDVCIQKVIVVTAGLDKVVRVWNYAKKKLEVVKQFDDDCLSIACHPTGLRVVIGFKYKLCMYNLLVNDLHLCTDFPVKNCREVRFSNGGQFFAAVIVNRILVFSSFNFDCIGSLQGHSSMVRSICWTKNDTGLVSAGFEGAIYEWKIEGMRKEEADENLTWKSTAYSALLYDDSTGCLVASGCNKVAEAKSPEGEFSIRQIFRGEEKACLRPGQVSTRHLNKIHTKELAVCSAAQTLFVGMPNGQLHLYKWPLASNATPYQKYEIHQGEILFLSMSPDEKYLYTVGEDLSLFMFEVDVIVEGRLTQPRRSFNHQVFDEVSYVLQGELDEKARQIESLRGELEELRREKDKEVTGLKAQTSSEHSFRVDASSKRLKEVRAELAQALAESEAAKAQVTENKRQLEELHMGSAEELEALYQRRTEEQARRYQALREERDDLVVRYENKIYRLQRSREEHRGAVVEQHD